MNIAFFLASTLAALTSYSPNIGELTEIAQSSPGEGRPQKRILVYLPPGYDTSDKEYPVLYLLHGARGNETSWIKKGGILDAIDSLTMCGKMQETITVPEYEPI